MKDIIPRSHLGNKIIEVHYCNAKEPAHCHVIRIRDMEYGEDLEVHLTTYERNELIGLLREEIE